MFVSTICFFFCVLGLVILSPICIILSDFGVNSFAPIALFVMSPLAMFLAPICGHN